MHIYFIFHLPVYERTTSARAIHTNSVISFLLACNLKVEAIVFLSQLQSPVFFAAAAHPLFSACSTAYLI